MKQRFSRFATAFLFGGLVASSAATHAAWTEASTRHFVIYSEDTPEGARRVAEKLERFDQALRYVSRLDDAKFAPANRLTVYVMRSLGEVQNLNSRRAVGFYVPKVD